MNTIKPFVKLKLEIPSNHKIYKEYLNFQYKQVEVPDNIYDKSLTFFQYTLPKDYFSGTLVGDIIDDLELLPKIFLIESNYVYNWHRDAFRNIAFNLTINHDTDYIVMFAPDFPSDKHHKNMMYEKIEEVKYNPGKFILFNTQVPHITINRGSSNRYLLTIAHYSGNPADWIKNKKIDYSEFQNVIEYLDKKNLLEE